MTDCKGEERTTAEENTKDFPLTDPTVEECYHTSRKNAAIHHAGGKRLGKDTSGGWNIGNLHLRDFNCCLAHQFPPQKNFKLKTFFLFVLLSNQSASFHCDKCTKWLFTRKHHPRKRWRNTGRDCVFSSQKWNFREEQRLAGRTFPWKRNIHALLQTEQYDFNRTYTNPIVGTSSGLHLYILDFSASARCCIDFHFGPFGAQKK